MMGATWREIAVLVVALTLLSPRPGAGQSEYLAGGVGPTPVLEGGGGNRNWFGMAGYPGRGIGFRIAGAETVSRLWLTADLTIQPRTPRLVRPYALLGAGIAIDFGETDPVFNVGGGIRVQVERVVFLFGETRLQTAAGSAAGSPRTILPITFGLGIGT